MITITITSRIRIETRLRSGLNTSRFPSHSRVSSLIPETRALQPAFWVLISLGC